MTTHQSLKGIYAAIVTPLSEDGSALDLPTLEHHVNRLVEAGVGGLIAGGTTGEFTALTKDERKTLHAAVVKAADGRVPVLAQTGALTTLEAIELTEHAKSVGAWGVLLLPPYYEGLTFDEVKQYYTDVTAAVEIPVMLYYFPDATRIELTVEEIAELATLPGIDYAKFSSYDRDVFFGARDQLKDSLQLLNGMDTEILESLSRGQDAVIMGCANVVPELSVAIYEAIKGGDLDRARELWGPVEPLLKFIESGAYVVKVKAALELLGESAGPTRRPLLPLSADEKAELAQLINALPTPVKSTAGPQQTASDSTSKEM